mmetsp:Transcript_19164/g.24866  ORF Transcript_19164/g.24866 Transcript_19164/m.24866 type:complete len:689 (+) Transcript_19164:95-2161(+)
MVSSSPLLDFSPIVLLKEELKSVDRAKRLHAIHGLKSIAAVIGYEMSRDELMKVIEEHVKNEEDDEVLFELGNVLDNEFIQLLGGSAYAMPLIQILRNLAKVEETVVHERATKSLSLIFENVPETNGHELAEIALETLKYLYNEEINTNGGLGSRMSTVYLLPATISILNKYTQAAKNEKIQFVLSLFCKLAKDDAPCVRKAAAEQIGNIALAIHVREEEEVFFGSDELFLAIWDLLCDEHDSVRVVAIFIFGCEILANLSHFSKLWVTTITSMLCAKNNESQTNNNDPIMMIVSSGSDDPSWRVRQALSKSFHGFLIYHCMEERTTSAQLIDNMLSIFAKLFYDREPEVRVATFYAVSNVAAVHRIYFANSAMILSAVCRGASINDTGKVRLAAARALTNLLAVLSPYNNKIIHDSDNDVDMNTKSSNRMIDDAQRCIFDAVDSKLFNTSVTDSFTSADSAISPNVDVLLEALSGIKDALPCLTINAANRVASLVQALNHDNWRVRRALINTLPALAHKCGREIFEAQLLEMFVHSFQDRICQVRMSAISVLAQICDLRHISSDDNSTPLFNSDWLMQKITKRLSELYLSFTYFVYRITIIQAFEVLAASSVLSDNHMKFIISFLSDATKDSVANVRLATARALCSALKTADDFTVANMIRPILNEIQRSEADIDVKLIVFQAIQVS